ncbi:hypothetical protein KR200_008574 [Drosophila serrata]|nr:hypothetical protein KR200_008574 [Drosophila serrata]
MWFRSSSPLNEMFHLSTLVPWELSPAFQLTYIRSSRKSPARRSSTRQFRPTQSSLRISSVSVEPSGLLKKLSAGSGALRGGFGGTRGVGRVSCQAAVCPCLGIAPRASYTASLDRPNGGGCCC